MLNQIVNAFYHISLASHCFDRSFPFFSYLFVCIQWHEFVNVVVKDGIVRRFSPSDRRVHCLAQAKYTRARLLTHRGRGRVRWGKKRGSVRELGRERVIEAIRQASVNTLISLPNGKSSCVTRLSFIQPRKRER